MYNEDLTKDPVKELSTIFEFLVEDIKFDRLRSAVRKTLEDREYKKWWDWGFTYHPSKESFFYELSKNRGKSNWKKIFDDDVKVLFHNLGGTEGLIRFGYEADEYWWKH
jgi:hypothetical protein